MLKLLNWGNNKMTLEEFEKSIEEMFNEAKSIITVIGNENTESTEETEA